MASQDYDIIKDIPGYKMILKAVLKSQIQQLVEQLASNTEEESVILTASVADGTLSHLGSQFGKGFLEDHEDIKSQFLGFCLKSHHKRKQDEEKKKVAESLQKSMLPLQNIYGEPPDPYFPQMSTFQSPRGQGPLVRPIMMHKAPVRSPGVRFEPYHHTRPAKRPSGRNRVLDSNPSPIKGDNPSDGQTIKIETGSDDESHDPNESDALNKGVVDSSDLSPSDDTSQNNTQSGGPDGNAVSETSNSTIPNEQTSDELACSSDTTNLISGATQSVNTDNNEGDESVYVKMEAISESELELEITGVEPGRPAVSQDNWDPNISMGMNFDPTAAGNQTDLLPQGYNYDDTGDLNSVLSIGNYDAGKSSKMTNRQALERFSNYFTVSNINDLSVYICSVDGCRKVFRCSRSMMRHIRTHTKEKPFCCRFCSFRSSRKDNLKVHEYKHVAQTSTSEDLTGTGHIDKAGM